MPSTRTQMMEEQKELRKDRGTAFSPADLALLFVAFLWGVSFTVIKDAYREIPAVPFVGMRFLLVGSSMIPFLIWNRRYLPRTRKAWTGALTIGVLGVAGYQILFSLGLQYTTASKSTLLVATSPLFTALVVAMLGIDRPRDVQLVGMVVALAGVAFLTLGDQPTSLLSHKDVLLGDVLTLGAAVATGSGVALAERYLAGADGATVMGVAVVLGSILIQPFAWAQMVRFPWQQVSTQAWLEMFYAAFLAGSLGYILWYRNIPRIGALRGSLYGFLIPLIGVVTAVVALSDRLTLVQGLGALFVLFGVAMARGWLGLLIRQVRF
ncbi:MAG: DMT family transporter [Armatimonadota bacterium]|nr:DMT family transporter [Armatimonadota bacterium]MDR5703199.1 DMT family transporter [Armatimonadota bacterium]